MNDKINKTIDQEFVTADEFIEFLKVKRKSPCNGCDARDWTTLVPDESESVFMNETQLCTTITDAGPVPTRNTDGAFGFLLVYCNNCGCAQHYAYPVVHQWVSEKREKAKSSKAEV